MSKLKFKQDDKSEELLPQALALVDDDSDDDMENGDNNPPMDGFAFLKSVIKERKKVAEVTVATIDPEKIKPATGSLQSFTGGPGVRVKPRVPEQFMPSTKWQNEQVTEFSDVRMKVNRHLALVRKKGEFKALKLPDKESEILWCLFCHGKEVWTLVEEKRKEQNEDMSPDPDPDNDEPEVEEESKLEDVLANSDEGTTPLLSVILSMPLHVVEKILEYQVSWLQCTGWREEYGAWLYSLLARVEKPLTPDMGSILRDLALFCGQERYRLVNLITSQTKNPETPDQSKMAETRGEEEEPDFPYHDEIAAFNLMICLVAKYFNQGDLADV